MESLDLPRLCVLPAGVRTAGGRVSPPKSGHVSHGTLCRCRPAGLVGPASEVTVLLSGVSGELAAQLTKRLSAKGVEHERILFCDYF